jgi:hypothetical protein
LILNFHLRESTGKSPDNGFIWSHVHIHTDHDAEVEHKLVSLVLLIFDADWIA